MRRRESTAAMRGMSENWQRQPMLTWLGDSSTSVKSSRVSVMPVKTIVAATRKVIPSPCTHVTALGRTCRPRSGVTEAGARGRRGAVRIVRDSTW